MKELTLNNVTKTYRGNSKKALNSFSAKLTPGVYGLVGPNGAGKSTLMNIITDNLAADEGQVLWCNKNIKDLGKAYREILGYMPQHQSVYEEFTGWRFLWYIAALKGLNKSYAKEQINSLISTVNLQNDINKKLGSFSGGMKQRILIAQALLNNPDVLILDEPTAGLDPKERIRLRNFISDISQNKIVIFATHVISDIDTIAKEIIFLKDGELLQMEKPSNIINEFSNKVFNITVNSNKIKDIQNNYCVSNISYNGKDKMTIKIVADTKPTDIKSEVAVPSLEDAYLYNFKDV